MARIYRSRMPGKVGTCIISNFVALAASLPGAFDQMKFPAFPSRLEEAGKDARVIGATAGVEG